MTFDEKAEVLARQHMSDYVGGFRGPHRLGVPDIRYQDGP
jgi:hypothetical protein